MAKALIYVSIVLTFFAAVGGFLTKQKIDLLNSSLTSKRQEAAMLTNDKQKLTADLKKTNEDLSASNKTVEDQKGQLQVAANDLATTKSDLEKSKTAETDAEAKATDATTKLAALQDQMDKMNPKGNATPEQIAQMQADFEKTKTELAEARQVQDTLKQRAHEFEDKNAALTARVKHYEIAIAKPGIMGRVVAVNSGWNFVVVDVGDKRGAAINAPLIVTRGGMTVARLKITSVEPGSSIADVVPGSVARGQSVQPGDAVIFAGRQDMTPPPAATPDGATPPPSGGQAGLGAGVPQPSL